MDSLAIDIRDKPWQAKKFNSRHRAVCVLKANGYTNAEICEHLGYDPSRVSVILNDPRAAEVLRDAEKNFAENLSDVGVKIQALAMEALEQTADVMRGGWEGIEAKAPTRLTAALSILDRAGYGKINKTIALEAKITGEAARALMGVEIEEIPDADYSLDEDD